MVGTGNILKISTVYCGLFSCLHRLDFQQMKLTLWDFFSSQYFPLEFGHFKPNAEIVLVSGKSPIDCIWVDPEHSSDFQLGYQERNNLVNSFMPSILLK